MTRARRRGLRRLIGDGVTVVALLGVAGGAGGCQIVSGFDRLSFEGTGAEGGAVADGGAPGPVLEIAGTITARELAQRIASAPAGPLTVRPAAGASSFAVTGDLTLIRPGVAIEKAMFEGEITFSVSASASSLSDGAALAVHIRGADDVTLTRNVFDGQARVAQNWIVDEPAGSVPERWRIVGNTFRNYYVPGSDASEALFLGYSASGLIEGNTFDTNGVTGHLFFSWWGDTANPEVSWPRDICVRGNTFTRSLNGAFAILWRDEIPETANIHVDPSTNVVTTGETLSARFVSGCP